MAPAPNKSQLYKAAAVACRARRLTFSRYPADATPGAVWLDIVPARRRGKGAWCLVQQGTEEPLSGRRGLTPNAMLAFLVDMAGSAAPLGSVSDLAQRMRQAREPNDGFHVLWNRLRNAA